jgi:hypothetical protein
VNPHQIAYSEDHDGICAVERSVTFHEAANEANPAFAHYRLSWEDARGCRHFVRYDVTLAGAAGARRQRRTLSAVATTAREWRDANEPIELIVAPLQLLRRASLEPRNNGLCDLAV